MCVCVRGEGEAHVRILPAWYDFISKRPAMPTTKPSHRENETPNDIENEIPVSDAETVPTDQERNEGRPV